MTTYIENDNDRRFKYALKVIDALDEHLAGVQWKLHIADDSEMEHYFNAADSYSWSGHQGIGASLNRAMEQVEGIWLYITDDWLLQRKLDLKPAVTLLENGFDIVRLGPLHPDLDCRIKFNQEIGWWWIVQSGRYKFATRPFLTTKQFYQEIGPFKEHVDAYECENDYAWRVSLSPVKIAAIAEASDPNLWIHIGEDYSVGMYERPS